MQLVTGTNTMPIIHIFTDGACRGNPGPGGWGALLYYGQHEKKMYGADQHTTNNRMELTAVIKALQALKQPCDIVLTTDSQYVKRGITEWIYNWHKNGWKTAGKQPVKNMDLWLVIFNEIQKHKIQWRWVRGHTGHKENEMADALANRAIDELNKSASGSDS